jgi:Mu-like prophage DNA circulation protein
MSWRDQLRPARLGNAPFLVEGAEAQLGRNTQVHEYPLRDIPYVEDLGRRARRFTMDAYVIGPNYMAARDALIAELEAPGMKTLVHPYLGEMRVGVVDSAGPRESTREGGMARFNIVVVEAGELRFPAATSDTQRTTQEKADIAIAAAEVQFEEDFNAGRLPAFIPQAATALVRDLSTRMSEIARAATTIPAEITGFVNDLSALAGSAAQLVLAPLTLARNVGSVIAQLRTIATGPPEALKLLRQMFGYGNGLPVISTGTTARQHQVDNQAAFLSLVQQASVIEAARLTSVMQFVSFEDALGIRDELIDELDAQGEAATSDSVYYALVDVRTAMVQDIQVRSADLARILRLTLNDNVPAIALAYQLYGDATLDQDISARNGIRDPLFLPSGTALEVLSDV